MHFSRKTLNVNTTFVCLQKTSTGCYSLMCPLHPSYGLVVLSWNPALDICNWYLLINTPWINSLDQAEIQPSRCKIISCLNILCSYFAYFQVETMVSVRLSLPVLFLVEYFTKWMILVLNSQSSRRRRGSENKLLKNYNNVGIKTIEW